MSYTADKNDQTVGETIPAALRFPSAQKASVVQSRESACFYPTSGMSVRSDQNRNTIFRISSSSFLDPKQTYLSMRVSVPDYRIKIEDMCTSLISAMTLTVGGVEVESLQHVDDQVRLNVMNSCPREIYEGHFAATMGAWKQVRTKRANMYHGTAVTGNTALTVAADRTLAQQAHTDIPAVNAFVMGQVWDDNAYPMADGENPFAVDWRDDGKKGHYVSIPLSLILGFFDTSQYIPLSFLGSIDLHISWQEFNKCCIVGKGFNRVNGVLQPETSDAAKTGGWGSTDVALALPPAADVPAANRYYSIDDVTIKASLVDLDRSYLSMLGALISSSASGLSIGFESHSNQQLSFTPVSENTIYQSRGFSYLKKAFFALRNQKIASNPYLVKSNYCFGDSFRSCQIELGSKLYPQYPIRNTTDAYEQLLIASDQHNNVDQAGLHSYESFHCRPNQFMTDVPLIPSETQAEPLYEPHRAPNQTFNLGMSFEKTGGKNLIDGVSLRLSGHSILLNLGLDPIAKTLNTAALRKKYPNGALYGSQMQLISVLKVQKSLQLRQDAVSVAE